MKFIKLEEELLNTKYIIAVRPITDRKDLGEDKKKEQGFKSVLLLNTINGTRTIYAHYSCDDITSMIYLKD